MYEFLFIFVNHVAVVVVSSNIGNISFSGYTANLGLLGSVSAAFGGVHGQTSRELRIKESWFFF